MQQCLGLGGRSSSLWSFQVLCHPNVFPGLIQPGKKWIFLQYFTVNGIKTLLRLSLNSAKLPIGKVICFSHPGNIKVFFSRSPQESIPKKHDVLPITQDDSKHIFQDSNSEASPPIQHILSPTFLEASVATLQPVEWWEASPSRKARKEHWPPSDSWLGHESVAPTIGCCGANCQPSAITKTTKTGETSLANKRIQRRKDEEKIHHSALQSTSNHTLTFLV